MFLIYSSQECPLPIGEEHLPVAQVMETVTVRVNWMMQLKTASATVTYFRKLSEELSSQVMDKEKQMDELQERLYKTQIQVLDSLDSKEKAHKKPSKMAYNRLQPWKEEQMVLEKQLGVVSVHNWTQQLAIINSHKQYFENKTTQLEKHLKMLYTCLSQLEEQRRAMRKQCAEKEKMIPALQKKQFPAQRKNMRQRF